MVVEVVARILASSLALLSDAAHMLTDAGAIGLALVAARLAARPPSGNFTFGLGRAEILSAQVNGAVLLVLAGVIAWEAGQRLVDPIEVEGVVVIAGGVLGARSEEHTSEPQSRQYLVCRLLLEKKKNHVIRVT